MKLKTLLASLFILIACACGAVPKAPEAAALDTVAAAQKACSLVPLLPDTCEQKEKLASLCTDVVAQAAAVVEVYKAVK